MIGVTFVLVGCGGGSSSSISGTVAVGAPIDGATVTVYDSSGNAVGTGTTSADGTYSVSVTSPTSGPLVIKVEFGEQALYSVKADAATGVANVTPLTHALAATLSASGNPAKLAGELAAGTSIVSEAAISSKAELLAAAIQPITEAVTTESGVEPGNFLTSPFVADGTGLDKVLDAVNVSNGAYTGSDGKAVATLEVSFNTPTPLDSAAPTAVNFTSDSSVQSVSSLVNGLNLSLPVPELPGLYRDFLSRLRTCYSQPLSERATNGTVSSQACKEVFYQADPAQYKDGGYGVGDQRWKGMVRSNKTIEITKGVKPYLLQNIKRVNGALEGRALLSFQGVDDEGSMINFSVVTKIYTLNGRQVLGAYGDQNAAEFYVNAETTAIEHPLNSDKSLDYVRSGYSVYAPIYEPTGKTLQTAILTTPKGGQIVMGKQSGRSSLRVCLTGQSNGNCTGIPIFVQGLIYVGEDPAAPTTSPIQKKWTRTNWVYSKTANNSAQCSHFDYVENGATKNDGCPRTDDEIEAQRAGGLWTLKLTYTDNTDVTLWTRHAARALSNRELLGPTGPLEVASKFTASTIDRLKALNTAAVGDGRAFSSWLSNGTPAGQMPIWSPATGGYSFDWDVPTGGQPARQVFLAGKVARYNDNGVWKSWQSDYRSSWEEKSRFKSTSRTAELTCSLVTGVYDISCDGVTGTWVDNQSELTSINKTQVTTNFAKGAYMSYAELWTKDQEQRNLSRGYNFFTPE